MPIAYTNTSADRETLVGLRSCYSRHNWTPM